MAAIKSNREQFQLVADGKLALAPLRPRDRQLMGWSVNACGPAECHSAAAHLPILLEVAVESEGDRREVTVVVVRRLTLVPLPTQVCDGRPAGARGETSSAGGCGSNHDIRLDMPAWHKGEQGGGEM